MTKAMRDGKHVALAKCFYCLGDGCILLHKRLGDISEAHGKVVDMTPCSQCAGYMKQGIILITIDDSKSEPGWNKPGPGGIPNPWRTGGFFVVTAEAFSRMFNGPAADFGRKHRWMFIEDEAARRVGLFEQAAKEKK